MKTLLLLGMNGILLVVLGVFVGAGSGVSSLVPAAKFFSRVAVHPGVVASFLLITGGLTLLITAVKGILSRP